MHQSSQRLFLRLGHRPGQLCSQTENFGRTRSCQRQATQGSTTVVVDQLEKRLDGMFETYVDSGLIAGAVCDVRQNGKILYQRASGYLDIEKKIQVKPDSIFKVFSMTKPLTAALIFQLEEQGCIKLEDPLHKYLPVFKDLKATRGGSLDPADWKPLEREVTILHLLLHTAGFTYSFLGRTALHRRYENLAIHARAGPAAPAPQSMSEVMERLASLPLLHQPGAQWSYGVSYDVLGAVAEAVTGEPLGAAMDRMLLRPLGMASTGFTGAAFLDGRPDGVATTYTVTATGAPPAAEGGAAGAAYHAGSVHYGGGGLLSAAGDYHRFLALLLAGGVRPGGGPPLLSPRAVRMLSTPQIPAGVPVRGGQALSFRRLGGYVPTAGGTAALADPARSAAPGAAGEFTWEGSESSHFLCDPVAGLAAVWLCQLRPLNTYPLLADLKRALYGGRA